MKTGWKGKYCDHNPDLFAMRRARDRENIASLKRKFSSTLHLPKFRYDRSIRCPLLLHLLLLQVHTCSTTTITVLLAQYLLNTSCSSEEEIQNAPQESRRCREEDTAWQAW